MTPAHPPHQLLCETCGYVIDGLPVDGACPECGRSIASSLPEQRTGSPWQNAAPDRKLRPWLATVHAMLRHPVATFDTLRFNEPPGWLFCRNAALASLLGIVPIVTFVIIANVGSVRISSANGALMLLLLPGFLSLVFLPHFAILTGIMAFERVGMGLITRVHGWRIDGQAARTIISHASAGWITGGLLIAVTFGGQLVWLEFNRDLASNGELLAVGFILGSWFLGLLHFETLVYIGMRRCKYANRVSTPLAASLGPRGATGGGGGCEATGGGEHSG